MESKRNAKRFNSVDDVLQLHSPLVVRRSGETVADDKVINYINKFNPTPEALGTQLKIVVCSSEASYLSSPEVDLVASLKKNFHLSDLSISNGIIDSYISLYGSCDAISKAGTYIAFLLAKANNFTNSQLTLKSPNYKLSVLIDSCKPPSFASPKQLYTQCGYHFHPEINLVYFHGYLSSIFASLTLCLQCDSCNVDESKISQIPLYSVHVDASIVDRGDANNLALTKSRSNAVQFISKYSSVSNLVV
jgi:hypothetical protein